MPKSTSPIHHRSPFLAGFMLVIFGYFAVLSAQETTTNSQLTVERIREQQTQAEASTDDETLQAKLKEVFDQAVDQLNRANTLEENRTTFVAAKESAAERAADLQRKLGTNLDAPTIDATQPLPELEQQLVAAQGNAKKLNQSLAEANERIAARTGRRKAIRERLLEIQKVLKSLETSKPGAAAIESSSFSAAQRIEAQTRNRLAKTEAATLEAELAAIEAEDVLELPRMQRDLYARELDLANRVVEALQIAVGQLRDQDAAAKVQATKVQPGITNPVILALSERNAAIAKQYEDLSPLIKQVQAELTSAKETRDKITSEAESAKQKHKAIGLTDAIGAMLRKQKHSLPNQRRFQQRIRNRADTISNAQLELLERGEEQALSVEQTLAQLADRVPRIDAEVYDQAAESIEKRNDLLSPLIRAQNEYFDLLVELSNTEQQIVTEIQSFESFIDQLVLWVRSSRPLYASLDFRSEDFWLFSPRRWQQAGRSLFIDFSTDWLPYLFAAVAMIGLLRNRFAFSDRIRIFGDQAESNTCISFLPTLKAIGLTMIAALPWPFLIGFFSWRCTVAPDNNEILKALSNGLFCAAAGYYPLDFFRLACKGHGLFQSHFGWPPHAVQLVRSTIRTFTLIGLPLVLLSTMITTGSNRLGRDTLERIPFIGITIALSYFVSRLFHANTGVFRQYFLRNPDGWLNRLRPVWFWLAVLSPLLLSGLTFFGFYYTAQQLAWRLFLTACLCGLLLILTASASRWLWVQRRKLSIEQSRQRREAQLQASQDGNEAAPPVTLPTAAELRDQVKQSRSLLKTIMAGIALLAIWFTWIDVLPALSFLEKWPLAESTMKVTDTLTDDAGSVTFNTREVIDIITIADVAFAIFVLALTVVSARNIPGVLEISVLQRLPIEASVRYAITTIVSYLIVLLGLVIACNSIGIHWNQIQWMATALTFGLAFGLQEMFANFVAGIIILFERPIRVGDIVTIDDVTGTVSRVQIRATTITNWDRKDYIVPNKDFITGRVLNWTLSDQVNRIVVNIGIAYGSDKQLALDTIHKVASEHPMTVDDPGPNVTFEGFGASSLDFVLRCYIAMSNMSSRLQVVHDLHVEIDNALSAANIEIAFPQQDIHIRGIPEALEKSQESV